MKTHKYKTGELVELFTHRLFAIKRVFKGFTGWEYDLESSLLNEDGSATMHKNIPEGFIIKKT